MHMCAAGVGDSLLLWWCSGGGPAVLDRSTKCDVFNVFSLLFGYDLIVTLLF